MQSPLGRRLICHTVMEDLAASEFHDDEYTKDAKRGCDHREEITGDDHVGVIANKGQPALGLDPERDDARGSDTSLPRRCDANPELQSQFVGDPVFTPSQQLGRPSLPSGMYFP